MKRCSNRVAAMSVAMAMVVAPAAVTVGGDNSIVQAAVAVASFDYSMPDRYGMDADDDGAVDSFVPTITCDGDGPCQALDATSAFPVVPDSWHVDLDACASNAVDHEWSVLSRPAVQVRQDARGGCDDFYAEFPAEGTYRVGLRVKTSLVGLWSDWTWQDVVVQDWLIISMGDSYGAGEGSPDVPVDPDTLSDVADAFAGLGDALAQLADFGPCNAGSGFDFDDCVAALDDAGDAAVAQGAEYIERLNDPVCDITRIDSGFDLGACIDLLVNLAVTVAENTIDAIGQAVATTYDTYVDRFQDVYDAATDLVDSFETAIANFEHGATWQDRRCHRSARAGASLAAMELERRDPRTSVTLVHVACTGATILQGLIDTYAGAEDETEATALPELAPQVHQAAQLIGDREIDVVQMSIGGNDVNFAPIIFSCILRTDCTQPNSFDDPAVLAGQAKQTFCPSMLGLSTVAPILDTKCRDFFDDLAVDPVVGWDAQTLFDRGRNGDPNDPLRPGASIAYDLLDKALHRSVYTGDGIPEDPGDPGLGLPADRNDRVYITEYVNPLLHESGRVCSFDDDGIDMIPGVSRHEASWLNATTVDQLTDVVRDGADQEGWNFVQGVVDGYESRYGRGHGYCADPEDGLIATPAEFGAPDDSRFMVRLQDAFLRQGNKMGGVHPSQSGYRQYAEQILPAWLEDLYTDPLTLVGPRRPDQAPFADAGPNRLIDEGSSVTLATDSYDGDLDLPLTYAWSSNSASFTVSPSDERNPTLVAVDDGAGVLSLTVDDADPDEGPTTDTALVLVRNVAPTVSDRNQTITEGSPLGGSLSYSDPGASDTHEATVDYDDGSGQSPATATGGQVPLSHTYPDEGIFLVEVAVTDDDGGTDMGTLTLTVENAPPIVGPVSAPITPVLIGTTVQATAPFTDAGVNDVHTASVDWGDGISSVASVEQSPGSGTIAADHVYTSTGIYTVTVTVDDGDSGIGVAQHLYVVVYDPSGGFVTGGGIIESPLGAYIPDPAAAGPATFAFVSKYAKGATVPQGNTSFRFNAAGFVFSSTSYDWLVVSGSKATYKGRGTVNGVEGFGFLLAAVDGDQATANGPDRLRLKVWLLTTGEVVYDNQLAAGDDAAPTTAIAAGAIAVGRAKK